MENDNQKNLLGHNSDNRSITVETVDEVKRKLNDL